jgi:bacterioferritin
LDIGSSVEKQLVNDHGAEDGAFKAYNAGIKLAVEQADNGTRELFESILKDEEAHIDWLEAQLDQINQMGVQVYLGEQLS